MYITRYNLMALLHYLVDSITFNVKKQIQEGRISRYQRFTIFTNVSLSTLFTFPLSRDRLAHSETRWSKVKGNSGKYVLIYSAEGGIHFRARFHGVWSVQE